MTRGGVLGAEVIEDFFAEVDFQAWRMTLAPSATKRLAKASPMPVVEPVTMITLSFSRMVGGDLFGVGVDFFAD